MARHDPDIFNYELIGKIIQHHLDNPHESTYKVSDYFNVSQRYVCDTINNHFQSLEGFENASKTIVKKYPGLFLKENKAIAA